MNVLLIGSGGREHAIAKSLAESQSLTSLYIAPGNSGTAEFGTNVPISDSDIPALLKFAQDHDIALTVVGPEKPLVLGITDTFNAAGLKIVGPDRVGAQLEGSKEWAKAFMARWNIPTAAYAAFSDYEAAVGYVTDRNSFPIVIKADGLASGKGVTVAPDLATATGAIRSCLVDGQFGAAGNRVVIEDFLKGEEASILAFVDGTTIVRWWPPRITKRSVMATPAPTRVAWVRILQRQS